MQLVPLLSVLPYYQPLLPVDFPAQPASKTVPADAPTVNINLRRYIRLKNSVMMFPFSQFLLSLYNKIDQYILL